MFYYRWQQCIFIKNVGYVNEMYKNKENNGIIGKLWDNRNKT